MPQSSNGRGRVDFPKKMKILQIPNYIYPHIGGIEQVCRDMLNALATDESVEQRVICFNDGTREDVQDEVDGVKVTRCGTVAKVFSQSVSLSFGKLLKRTVKQFTPDYIVFHYPNPFEAHYLLKVLKRHKECKLIVWWHLDITKQKTLGKLFHGQTERLLKRAVKIVATSPNYAEGSAYLRRYREKCTVVPNCISERRMTVTEENRKMAEEIRARDEGKTLLLAVGRHVPYKGMEYLLRASAYLDENFVIYIGGEGPLTQSLKELAAGDGRIRFLGVLETQALKAYMLACDIFCFPSITKNEAFGLALAEAMYLEKPAVTFAIEGSGVNFVNLNGATGLEVANGDVQAYAQAIRTLAEDESLRRAYGKAAHERVEEKFTTRTFERNVTELFQSLAGEG